jgi:hypothetical protein
VGGIKKITKQSKQNRYTSLEINFFEIHHFAKGEVILHYTGEERRIPFIFDDFDFCHSRVIGLDMTENRIFTLCRMIT